MDRFLPECDHTLKDYLFHEPIAFDRRLWLSILLVDLLNEHLPFTKQVVLSLKEHWTNTYCGS